VKVPVGPTVRTSTYQAGSIAKRVKAKLETLYSLVMDRCTVPGSLVLMDRCNGYRYVA
jgi:hypothetical protein